MLKHIEIIPLVVGFVVGIIAVVFIKPQQNVVYKYPTPDNASTLTYKDKNGICYKYTAAQVDCDKNEAKLRPYPLST